MAALTELVFALTGLMLTAFALHDLQLRRWGNGAFWLLLGALFGLGSLMPPALAGLLVVALVALDGCRLVKGPQRGYPPPPRLPGPRIMIPIVIIPLAALVIVAGASRLHLTGSQSALVGLGLGALSGSILALLVTGGTPRQMLEAGHHLNETLGPVTLLPQLLAALGTVFTVAGVGTWLAAQVVAVVPEHSLIALIVANCLAMVTLSTLTGNSFAAFPIIAGGLTVPLLIGQHHGPVAACALLTLTVGASGTLMTPMAANFNLVPPALLEMRNPYGVIKVQIPVALGMLGLQIAAMWLAFQL